MESGDWLIAECERGKSTKKLLCRYIAAAKEPDRIRVELDGAKPGSSCGDEEGDDENATVLLSEIVANLGPDPRPGTAYGVKVEPLWDSRPGPEDSFIGTIFYRRKLDEKQREILDGAIDAALKLADHFTFEDTFDLAIRPATKSKTVGKFITGTRPMMELFPKDEHFEDAPEIIRAFLHELGHKHWKEKLNRRTRAEWVQTFQEHLERIRITAKDLRDLQAAVTGCKTVKDALKVFGEDEQQKETFRKVLKHIEANFRTGKESIDDTFDMEDLNELWPKEVSWGQYDGSVTEYGNKNPVEDFCECFSFHVFGLPMDQRNEDRIKAALGAIAIDPQDKPVSGDEDDFDEEF